MLIEKIVVGPLRTNCYLVAGGQGRRGILIDPGAEAARIADRAGRLGLEFSYILLTHGHADHIAAAAEIKKFFPAARVAIHKADAFMLKDERRSLGASVGILHPPIGVDVLLEDGWRADLAGDLKLTAIHTPGHSPGGVCFVVPSAPKARCLFSGDTLFWGAVGRTDIAGADRDTLVESIEEKLFSLPDRTVVYPGHGRETTIGEEKKRRGRLLK